MSLLVALPVTYEEFLHRVEHSDYLAKFRSNRPSAQERRREHEKRWQPGYFDSVAEPLKMLMSSADRLGIKVRSQATLNDLAAAAVGNGIVVIFAHWKGHEVLADDLSPELTIPELKGRAAQADSSVARYLRTRCAESSARSWTSRLRRLVACLRTPIEPTHSVRELLTEALKLPAHADTPKAPGIDEVLELEVLRQARRRDELDCLYGELLRPGNRLELFDGLFSKEQLDAAISPRFRGYLDLTTCTSSVLAEHFGRRRRYQVRTVQFPAEQEPRWGAHCLELAFRLLVETGAEYGEARMLATSLMEQALTTLGPDGRYHE